MTKTKWGANSMTANQYSIDELAKIIAPIAKKYGIARVYLFGSCARGDSTEASDIDLRIEKGQLRGMFALGGFYADVAGALQTEVDVLTTGSLDETFLQSIAEDEVLLYAG
jgi:predicted nucleotidyltransferase